MLCGRCSVNCGSSLFVDSMFANVPVPENLLVTPKPILVTHLWSFVNMSRKMRNLSHLTYKFPAEGCSVLF